MVQVAPVAQLRPQAPQLLLLVCVFTQLPPQLVRPIAQVVPQVPRLQTWPPGQEGVDELGAGGARQVGHLLRRVDEPLEVVLGQLAGPESLVAQGFDGCHKRVACWNVEQQGIGINGAW